jgi:hypothetical protein
MKPLLVVTDVFAEFVGFGILKIETGTAHSDDTAENARGKTAFLERRGIERYTGCYLSAGGMPG